MWVCYGRVACQCWVHRVVVGLGLLISIWLHALVCYGRVVYPCWVAGAEVFFLRGLEVI